MTEHDEHGDEGKGPRQRMGDGIKSGIGVLSAFKDALEETIRDARERGDLSAERARELMREAFDKAQTAASGARERLDFVTHSEFETLQGQVEALAARVAVMEGQPSQASGDEVPNEEQKEG